MKIDNCKKDQMSFLQTSIDINDK